MAEQKAKVVHGPGPRGMGGPRPKVENPGKLLKRIMAEVFQHYLPHCILVLICIVVSALANVQASLFLQTLIDDYIIPMTQQQDPSFAPLAGALVRVGCIYVVGILAAWLNARIMVNVTQGTLRNLRTQLFTHMESLPISYFDTHPHGDIMSVYTNDVDTLRQMLSQSIPQLVSSAITIVSVFASMCMLSWQLTIVTMLMVALMLFCSKKITQQSGKYFIAQQRDLGKVNGYIEEMMEGQKVVKVFTHEQKALEGFRELNDKLKDSAKQANSFANIMMPVNAQLGNISYAICALVGAAMAVTGMGGVTVLEALKDLLSAGMSVKIREHLRISIPVLISAIIPQRFFLSINALIKTNKLNPDAQVAPQASTDLEVFIYLKESGPESLGHVDISFQGKIYSYGCHDPHHRGLFGTLGDGVAGNDGITHVALYVGDGYILNCGNPISYADLSRAYWQEHFYGFGRMYE